MRIFVAGATGVLGERLLPLLVANGHDVAGMTRTPAKRDLLDALGATPVVCDVFDADALVAAMVAARPDVVIDELTDLPDDVDLVANFAEANNRIREQGTRNVLAAATAAGAERVIAQSIAWEVPGRGNLAKTFLETAVLESGGVVLRYGRFYGPGTYFESALPDHPRIHIDEAARRSVSALDAPSGIVHVVEP